MALIPGQIGDNPAQPFASAETYIPDQLIAGNLKIVSDPALIGGNVALARGTVMGQKLLSTIAATAGKTYASQTIIVAALPAAGDTLTVFGTVITFVAANPSGNQVLIGGPGLDGYPPVNPTIAGTATALVNFLIGSADANLVKATYSLASATITATAVAIGTGGNALTLATSNAVAFTLGAATLTGGTANTGAETIGTISSGSLLLAGKYLVTLTSATLANVFDPTGDMIGVATVGTQFTDPQISFLITTGAGIAAGDQFSLAAAPGTGQWVMAVGSALDGSQNPSAVLADDSDPTAGAVMGGLYLMGEFNINAMTFGPGISILAAKAALRPLGIFLKTSVSAVDPS